MGADDVDHPVWRKRCDAQDHEVANHVPTLTVDSVSPKIQAVSPFLACEEEGGAEEGGDEVA